MNMVTRPALGIAAAPTAATVDVNATTSVCPRLKFIVVNLRDEQHGERLVERRAVHVQRRAEGKRELRDRRGDAQVERALDGFRQCRGRTVGGERGGERGRASAEHRERVKRCSSRIPRQASSQASSPAFARRDQRRVHRGERDEPVYGEAEEHGEDVLEQRGERARGVARARDARGDDRAHPYGHVFYGPTHGDVDDGVETEK
jgi:hypothetical protein